ncbi:hypothetical protein [Oryzihumus sp.]
MTTQAPALRWDVTGAPVRIMALWRSVRFPLAIYLAARAVSAILIAVAAREQVAISEGASGYNLARPSPAAPGYLGVATNWDGQWYERIALSGYPSELPLDQAGQVRQNEWAFYPLYPMAVRLLMALSGLGFDVAAASLSATVGLLAVMLVHRLIRDSAGTFAAKATVVLLCVSMAAPALQIAYTESLALALVAGALLLLRRRRYLGLIPVLGALALTRPIVLAIVPVILVHGWLRYRSRASEPFPVRERAMVSALAVGCLLLTGVWPAVAAVRTGHPDAYLRTMAGWGGYQHIRPGMAWLAFIWANGGLIGLTIFAVLVGLFGLLVAGRASRPWGPELRTWSAAYPMYLLAGTAPGSSIVRYLLLAFPLFWLFPAPTTGSRDRRIQLALVGVLAAAGLVLQWTWVRDFLVISSPPGGRAFP